MRSHRSSRIVRGTHVEQAGVGGRGEHGFDIMRIRFRQRSFDDTRSGDFRRFHTSFVTGIGGDVALGW